jgi:hydroxymethylpyrimidine pyrophosphatase-like HAD family hydrolase
MLPLVAATDLDGTVVRSDDTVSAYTHDVFSRVRAAGIPVVGVTGRGPRLLELTRQDLPSASYLVMAGGGRVIDLTGPAPVTLADLRLDGPSLAALLDELEAAAGPLTVMVESADGPWAPLCGDEHPDSWPWPQPVTAMSRAEALDGPVIKAFVRANGDVDGLFAIAGTVIPPSKASLTLAGHGFVEICPPSVDKGTGLAVVASALGVDPKGVLAFGDMPNDIPMFSWAGWRKVAVRNAHPSVLALADEVTLTNDEDGVAVWLDQLLSRER